MNGTGIMPLGMFTPLPECAMHGEFCNDISVCSHITTQPCH